MSYFIKILFIVIIFSSCSLSNQQKCDSSCIRKTLFNQNYFNKNFVGMTREQIIYMFDKPIISDSFQDVYHYCFYDRNDKDIPIRKILNLYFKDNKVYSFNIT